MNRSLVSDVEPFYSFWSSESPRGSSSYKPRFIFYIKHLETKQSLSGAVAVGFARFNGIEASNSCLGLWAKLWLLGYKLNL